MSGRGGAGNFWANKEAQQAAAKAKAEVSTVSVACPLLSAPYRRDSNELTSPPRKQDPEAQKPQTARPTTASTAVADQTPTNGVPFTRAGRGGAGNFHDSADVQAARERDEAADRERARARAAAAPAAGPATTSRAKMGGRGGMGNWVDNAAERALEEQEEQRRRDELEAKVLLDVESGLAPPPKAYRNPTKK